MKKKQRMAAWGFVLVILLTFMSRTNVYASEEQMNTYRRVDAVSQDLECYYEDQAGIKHTLTFHVEGYIDVEWKEDDEGWVNALILNISNARIDGILVSSGLGSSTGKNNTCNFKINHKADFVTVFSSCDEWGDYDLWARCNP